MRDIRVSETLRRGGSFSLKPGEMKGCGIGRLGMAPMRHDGKVKVQGLRCFGQIQHLRHGGHPLHAKTGRRSRRKEMRSVSAWSEGLTGIRTQKGRGYDTIVTSPSISSQIKIQTDA